MGEIDDVATGLVSIAIGGAAVWARSQAADRLRYRHARGFWHGLTSPELTVVVGLHPEPFLTIWEPSGLLGLGDAFALAELQRQLDRIGVRQPAIMYSDRISSKDWRKDLILIGSPDANDVTHKVMSRLDTTLHFGDPASHEVALHDTLTQTVYIPRSLINGEGIDYGLLIRASNPFNPKATVLIIAGSFGYGSWAGARLVTDKAFLKEPLVASGLPFECLFTTSVIDREPQRIDSLLIRSLNETKGLPADVLPPSTV